MIAAITEIVIAAKMTIMMTATHNDNQMLLLLLFANKMAMSLRNTTLSLI